MEKKLSLAIFLALFVLSSQQAFAQSSCGLVTFADDSFTLNSGETKNISFTVKNFGAQDFFVDELAIEKNPFFFSEKTSGKIFEESTSLMSVKVVASAVETTEFVPANASIIGHFEDGQRCFVEKEFYFQINPITQKAPTEPLNVAVSAWSEVDSTGSGFVSLQAKNDSPKAIEIVIEPRGARLGVGSVWVEAFSFKKQALTINGADDNELVFFKVYSGGELLFEKFTQVKYPAQEDGGITFEEDDAESPVFISSYSQKVEFVNDKAEAWIVVENRSDAPVEVFVEIRNLPQGITSVPVAGVILPNEKKQFRVQASGRASEEFFSAILSVNGKEFSLNRLVLFEQKKEAPGVVGQAGPAQGFGGAAFLFLSQNSLGFLVLIVVLVVLALAFSEKSKDSLQAWVTQQQ